MRTSEDGTATAPARYVDGNRRAQPARGQGIWLRERDERLARLAGDHRVGRGFLLGSVPLDPLLQWQEQLITDGDVMDGAANPETRNAFDALAVRIMDDSLWETL